VPLVVGAALAYNVAAVLYRVVRRPVRLRFSTVSLRPSSALRASDARNPLDRYRAIGIILAGGGAKGAYQAGALAALDDFLRVHGASDRVKAIAGTSIGAWNALFWLSGSIRGTEGRTTLDAWWSQISLRNVVDPAVLWPARQNYVLSNTPWQEWFAQLFCRGDAANRLTTHLRDAHAEGGIHFYFTRANVRRGSLEFVTNCAAPHSHARLPNPSHGARARIVTSLDELGRAVLSSMDFPPAFPYFRDDGEWFEDGGVIDNLPIRFGTQVYACDLLFVFPLNA